MRLARIIVLGFIQDMPNNLAKGNIMSTVTTVPGIYIDEDASPAISVSQGGTAVPLFIARFLPRDDKYLGVIIRINSWLDFNNKFFASTEASVSVEITTNVSEDVPPEYHHTFDTPVVSTPAAALALQLYFQNGGGACYVFALNDSDDNKALAALPALVDQMGDITLFAVPENDDAYRNAVYRALVGSLNQHKGYFLLADSSDGNAPSVVGRSASVAVYYPPLITVPQNLDDRNVAISGYKDASSNTPTTLVELQTINADLAQRVTSAVAAIGSAARNVAASALMAGVYCKTDRQRGVWKAPANVVLNGVSDVSVRVTDDAQGQMNQAGINVIRYFSDRGVVVWGTRTLQNDDNWRYIPVRRLFDAAERDIKQALLPMVFEPNNQMTWKRVQVAIDHYLYRLWQQGGLVGNRANEAYFVRIGKDITMSTADINQGKMIVQVGMAAVRPAEFIILQFNQNVLQ